MTQLDEKSKLSTRVLGKSFEVRSSLNKRLAMKKVPLSDKMDNFIKQENKAKHFFDLTKEVKRKKYKMTPEQMAEHQKEYNRKIGGYFWNGGA